MRAHRKLWVDALRSGKYQQTQGYLHTKSGFCCLGVACDVYQAEVGDLTVACLYNNIISYDSYTAYLPSKVKNWLGLTTSFGDYNARSLALDNDTGLTFAVIANLIESEVNGLVNV